MHTNTKPIHNTQNLKNEQKIKHKNPHYKPHTHPSSPSSTIPLPLIHNPPPPPLIPEITPLVRKIKPLLLLQRHQEKLPHHAKQPSDIFQERLAARLLAQIQVEETKVAACAPAAFFFVWIPEEFGEGDAEEGCGGDGVWEGGRGRGGRGGKGWRRMHGDGGGTR